MSWTGSAVTGSHCNVNVSFFGLREGELSCKYSQIHPTLTNQINSFLKWFFTDWNSLVKTKLMRCKLGEQGYDATVQACYGFACKFGFRYAKIWATGVNIITSFRCGQENPMCWKTMTYVTWQCVRVLAPAGRACCKKTAEEILSVESGVSADSRNTLLPTGPLSQLHK